MTDERDLIETRITAETAIPGRRAADAPRVQGQEKAVSVSFAKTIHRRGYDRRFVFDERNLIETWLAAETAIPGRRAADALRDLSEAVGGRYGHSQLSQWRRGRRTPPPAVLRHMARASAEHIAETVLFRVTGFGSWALSDEALDELAAMVTPPIRRK